MKAMRRGLSLMALTAILGLLAADAGGQALGPCQGRVLGSCTRVDTIFVEVDTVYIEIGGGDQGEFLEPSGWVDILAGSYRPDSAFQVTYRDPEGRERLGPIVESGEAGLLSFSVPADSLYGWAFEVIE